MSEESVWPQPGVEVEILSTGGSVTVSSGPDNNYNNCIASKYGGARRHNSTSGAISNLMSMVALDDAQGAGSGGPPIIGGHGNDGFIETGSGQTGSQNNSNTIGTWNESTWGPLFAQLRSKNYPILTLLSCNTGAGEEGADLLFAMAKRTGKSVRARTGLTTCGGNGITFEPGSTWQTASPTVRPNPIPRPSLFVSAREELLVMTDGDMKRLNTDSISAVTVRRNPTGLAAAMEQRVEGSEARSLVSLIDFGRPFRPGGVFGAMPTAEIELHSDAFGEAGSKRLVIYNYAVAQDADDPDVYYPVSSAMRTLLS